MSETVWSFHGRGVARCLSFSNDEGEEERTTTGSPISISLSLSSSSIPHALYQLDFNHDAIPANVDNVVHCVTFSVGVVEERRGWSAAVGQMSRRGPFLACYWRCACCFDVHSTASHRLRFSGSPLSTTPCNTTDNRLLHLRLSYSLLIRSYLVSTSLKNIICQAADS